MTAFGWIAGVALMFAAMAKVLELAASQRRRDRRRLERWGRNRRWARGAADGPPGPRWHWRCSAWVRR